MTMSEPDDFSKPDDFGDNPELDPRTFRLTRRGRAADPDFAQVEHLYRRCLATEQDPGDPERLFPDQISFYPDWSVNREKFSRPEDVLYPGFLNWGIAAFQVQDIPAPYQTEGNVTYHWTAQHVPLEDNYPHTEVWTHKNNFHLGNPKTEAEPSPPKLPSTVKKYFRTVLSERARIIHPPVL